MHSPKKPPGDSEFASSSKAETEFKQALDQVEGLLENLKQRHTQVQTAAHEKTRLQRHLHDLKGELDEVKERLEALEVDLESRLFSWQSQRETFWHVIRFVGLGFVLGQILNACTS